MVSDPAFVKKTFVNDFSKYHIKAGFHLISVSQPPGLELFLKLKKSLNSTLIRYQLFIHLCY